MSCTERGDQQDYVKAAKKALSGATLQSFLSGGFLSNDSRDPQTSEECREEGNNFYRRQQYYQAISSYSKAYALAKGRPRDASLAVANRSAVHAALGFFKECISDVKLALSMNYPDELKYKLYQRLAVCYKATKNKQLAEEYYFMSQTCIQEKVAAAKREAALANLKQEYEKSTKPQSNIIRIEFKKPPNLSDGSRRDMPGVSAALCIKENSNYGQHFVAKRNIQTGEVLFVEEPLVCGLVEKRNREMNEFVTSFTHCFHCFKLCFTLSPCDHCSFAMFCSNECKKEAWKNYHEIECKARSTFDKLRHREDYTTNSIMVVTCVRFVATFGVDVCIAAMINPESAPKKMKDFLSLPPAFYAMETVDSTRRLALNLASLCFGLSGWKRIKLAEFMVLSLMVYKRNTYSISIPQLQAETEYKNNFFSIGWGLNKHAARIIHSCSPNVIGVNYMKTHVALAYRPIRKGEPISTNYIDNCALESVADRREQLMHQYNFHCKCESCGNGWAPKTIKSERIFQNNPSLRTVMVPMADWIFAEDALSAKDINSIVSKVHLQQCLKAQDMFLKVKVPKMEEVFLYIKRFISLHYTYDSLRIYYGGNKGDPYLFPYKLDNPMGTGRWPTPTE
ncbi:uncharacterized protein LOC132205511 [Neocloeon triangulifer]|uniref:uncharacterized protein LOC132205511 n=1 Tax=Neocloeon triangulifer TaxID=2078957 RepID=UPI00286F9377|nr:uncharacterized protein LOC132205511 [Neocloeon triangulifer]